MIPTLILSGCTASAPAFAIQELRGSLPRETGTHCLGDPLDRIERGLVVFSIPGCEPCKRQLQALDRAKIPEDVAVHHVVVHASSCNAARLDTRTQRTVSVALMDERASLAWGFQVSPTLVYVEAGRACRMAVGVVGEEELPRVTQPCP